MKRAQDEIKEELASLAGIIRILRQRRTQLQRQAALRGSNVDPAVRIEIEDITAQVRGHEEEVAHLETLLAEGDQPRFRYQCRHLARVALGPCARFHARLRPCVLPGQLESAGICSESDKRPPWWLIPHGGDARS